MNTTNDNRAVACIRFVRRWWLYLRPPLAPCMFCGKPTRERNAFDHSIVRHQSCRNEAEERNKAERSKREKIELIKRAIREVQAETPNEKLSHTAPTTTP